MEEAAQEHALYYNDDLVANLQLRWGSGFMSPGGAEEIRHMREASTFPVARASTSDVGSAAMIACW